MTHTYIGLISGTSMDGIDAVLATVNEQGLRIEHTLARPYPAELRGELLAAAAKPGETNIEVFGRLHGRVAREFAATVDALLAGSGRKPSDISASGSHGQTVLHAPAADPPFSLQLGDPGVIAALTYIPVVGDFRNSDMALGGEGAPLVPAFHAFAFGAADATRALVNIGGIANVTWLPARGEIKGFDTGPGNTLLDEWYRRHHSEKFDEAGQWAAEGRVQDELLTACLADPYFAAPPPKSTGTDYFCRAWLDRLLVEQTGRPEPPDVQATLAELSAASIADAIRSLGDTLDTLAVCGGGAHNTDLVTRLQRRLPDTRVDTTASWGIEPDWVEAAAFAWLAHERLAGRPGNVPSVTGARHATPLGGIYLPPDGGLRQM